MATAAGRIGRRRTDYGKFCPSRGHGGFDGAAGRIDPAHPPRWRGAGTLHRLFQLISPDPHTRDLIGRRMLQARRSRRGDRQQLALTGRRHLRDRDLIDGTRCRHARSHSRRGLRTNRQGVHGPWCRQPVERISRRRQPRPRSRGVSRSRGSRHGVHSVPGFDWRTRRAETAEGSRSGASPNSRSRLRSAASGIVIGRQSGGRPRARHSQCLTQVRCQHFRRHGFRMLQTIGARRRQRDQIGQRQRCVWHRWQGQQGDGHGAGQRISLRRFCAGARLRRRRGMLVVRRDTHRPRANPPIGTNRPATLLQFRGRVVRSQSPGQARLNRTLAGPASRELQVSGGDGHWPRHDRTEGGCGRARNGFGGDRGSEIGKAIREAPFPAGKRGGTRQGGAVPGPGGHRLETGQAGKIGVGNGKLHGVEPSVAECRPDPWAGERATTEAGRICRPS